MVSRGTVAVVSAGGTITMVGADHFDLVDYGEYGEALAVDDVLARQDLSRLGVDVVTVGHRQVSSTAMTPADWLRLADVIRRLAATRPDIEGFVVLHGTATLEETAYFLHLALGLETPVVVVGAQRPISAISSDAPLNLVNAIEVAAASDVRGMGVLVVLNGEIHSAREVSKTSTYKLEAFQSPGSGPLGVIGGDGRVFLDRRPVRTAIGSPFAGIADMDLPRVDISFSYAGADGAAIDAFVAAGARAIVNAGLAPGKVSATEEAAVRRATDAGVMIVRSTRAGMGRVLPRRRLIEQGVIAADDLSPQKARVLAMLALAVTDDRDTISSYFERF